MCTPTRLLRSLLPAAALLGATSGLLAAPSDAARDAAGLGIPAEAPKPPARPERQASALQALAIGLEKGEGGAASRVTVAVDRARLMAALPSLREHGAVPEGVTTEQAKQRPAFTVNLLSLLLTSWAVRDAYMAAPGLGATSWKVFLSPASGGQEGAAQEMFSFAMDRPRYERTAWDKLALVAFPGATTGFGYNLRFAYQVSREAGGIEDD